ncbi:superoxide dismutase [Triangularia verruculosa]|uniref:superoxide dismutase n=1 Tax=Triangularia verruculosa TaxID=2587418 RepID=A0AAN6XRA4_9PEZI|nr:superoxide dismutase [Triangularia verruculosa]
MRVSNNLSLLLAAGVTAQTVEPETGKLGNATVVTNNPVGVVYKAVLPAEAWFKPAYPDGGNIEGEVTAVAAEGGTGVVYTYKFSNLPKEGGPFPYHLHVAPVPENGNCTVTLAHLDPFVRGENTTCDSTLPETCQVGDLSGKFGAIVPEEDGTWETTYTDLYSSTLEGIGAFFGNRSIVFHYPNKTRISCANFEKVEDGGVSSSVVTVLPTPTGNGSYTILPTGGVSTSTTGGDGPSTTTSGGAEQPTTSAPISGAGGLRSSAAGALVLGAVVMFML